MRVICLLEETRQTEKALLQVSLWLVAFLSQLSLLRTAIGTFKLVGLCPSLSI